MYVAPIRPASVVIKGRCGLTKGEAILASDPVPQSIREFEDLGAQASSDNRAVVKQSDVVFLAVKPQVLPDVLSNIKPYVGKRHLLISIAMGISIKDIEKALPPSTRVIRVMPNTPALVRNGASVFVSGSSTTAEDEVLTRRLLEAVGTCDKVPESMMDVVTALSGSGPAYIYVIIEALADGAVRMGMPRDLAYRLVTQTVIGAGNMARTTKIHPGELKDNVTSPAGSTAEGLYFLEQHRLRSALIGAIQVATQRCKEMNEQIKKSLSSR
ncbi:pyrroline-5-carboxylate reductase 3 isoform X2 [Periplaneta americana]|uniref:pyrroline-5-carboxylate reductase 3 isoform X2 n=1 Tax=Periplaneta americana TaxID=6978 RepID=UPI0037E7CBC5